MPVPGLFAAFYWPGDGLVNTVVTPTGFEPYQHPRWFDGSTLGMGLGVWPTLPVPRERYRWEKYVKRLNGRLHRLVTRLPARLLIIPHLVRAYCSHEFTLALDAVQQVSQDPTTRHIETWGEIGRRVVSNPKQGENVFRQFAARTILNDLSPRGGLLIELAVLAQKAKH